MTKTIFISHASEDKDLIARPLAEKLHPHFKVWFDESDMVLGDSIPNKIGFGLRESRFGVIILSHNFFKKPWTNSEVDALLSGQNASLIKILPIWHGVNYEDVYRFNPLLAARLAVNTDQGLDQVVTAIIDAVLGRSRKQINHSAHTIDTVLDMGRTLNRKDGEIFIERKLQEDVNKKPLVPCTVCLLDVDGLTQINRRFGVDAGDKILARIGRMLSRWVNSTNPVGRCGDDTFFVVFWGLGEKTSKTTCQRLVTNIKNANWKKFATDLHVSCSLGFAERSFNEPIRDCLVRAAQAMRLAKESGRGEIQEASEFLAAEASRDLRSYYS